MAVLGYLQGEKVWLEREKVYQSQVELSCQIRPRFVPDGAAAFKAAGNTKNQSSQQRETIKAIGDRDLLEEVVEELDLVKKLGEDRDSVVSRLQRDRMIDFNQEENSLVMTLRGSDPDLVATVLNAIAKKVPGIVERVDQEMKRKALEGVEDRERPSRLAEARALAKLKELLEKEGVVIDPTQQKDWELYWAIDGVYEAKQEWDEMKRQVVESKGEGRKERSFWKRAVPRTFVVQPAIPGEDPVGPTVEDLASDQQMWGAYGLIAGLLLGTLLAFICSRLFR